MPLSIYSPTANPTATHTFSARHWLSFCTLIQSCFYMVYLRVSLPFGELVQREARVRDLIENESMKRVEGYLFCGGHSCPLGPDKGEP